MKVCGKGHGLALKHRPNWPRKLGKKTIHDKSIPLPQLLADSHLPFLDEGFWRAICDCKTEPNSRTNSLPDAPSVFFPRLFTSEKSKSVRKIAAQRKFRIRCQPMAIFSTSLGPHLLGSVEYQPTGTKNNIHKTLSPNI